MLSELFSKLELVSKECVGMSTEGLPLSGAISADRGQAAWVLLIDSDQCLGHGEGTVVKADIGHFTLLIKLLLLKVIDVSDFFTRDLLKCPLGGDKSPKDRTLTFCCFGSARNQGLNQRQIMRSNDGTIGNTYWDKHYNMFQRWTAPAVGENIFMWEGWDKCP